MLVVSILERSVQDGDDAGIVIQWYPIRGQLETGLVISLVKVTCQHSVEPSELQQRCEGERYPFGELPLVVPEWQYNRLKYQTGAQT
ncbi:hypothetical protein TNCV_4988341 [Trichonephila clavipes]|nr:hypothetical protein TNCV_4988341 [Trichonephila clavipes]